MKKTLASALRALARRLDPPVVSYFTEGAKPKGLILTFNGVDKADAADVAKAISWAVRTAV